MHINKSMNCVQAAVYQLEEMILSAIKAVFFNFSLLAVIFLTDAVEVTDEDINSPLVSYLLAKLQQLESKVMVRLNIRTTKKAY